jgi:hypothetical protein
VGRDYLAASYDWLPKNRHDSAWALRSKAVLIRNRKESRFGRETELSTADRAYVVRTNDDDTRSMPEHNPLGWNRDAGTASRFSGSSAFVPSAATGLAMPCGGGLEQEHLRYREVDYDSRDINERSDERTRCVTGIEAEPLEDQRQH